MTRRAVDRREEGADLLLRHALAEVTAAVPYLTATVGPVETVRSMDDTASGTSSEGWLSCSDLVNDSELLIDVIRASGRTLGTDDPVVAASILVQGYAYRLLAISVACLCTTGVVPICEPSDVSVGLSNGYVARVAFVAPRLFVVDRGEVSSREPLGDSGTTDKVLHVVIESVIKRHLRPLIAKARSELRIGGRLLWGNVAASASTAFSTMEGCLGPWVIPLGERFFELAPQDLANLGSSVTIEASGRRGRFWERTNCCLHDRLAGGVRCADCSRTPRGERRAAYAASLAE